MRRRQWIVMVWNVDATTSEWERASGRTALAETIDLANQHRARLNSADPDGEDGDLRVICVEPND